MPPSKLQLHRPRAARSRLAVWHDTFAVRFGPKNPAYRSDTGGDSPPLEPVGSGTRTTHVMDCCSFGWHRSVPIQSSPPVHTKPADRLQPCGNLGIFRPTIIVIFIVVVVVVVLVVGLVVVRSASQHPNYAMNGRLLPFVLVDASSSSSSLSSVCARFGNCRHLHQRENEGEAFSFSSSIHPSIRSSVQPPVHPSVF